jgi:hypothetical protein
LLFTFPPIIILGANFVPLINVSILLLYFECCKEQASYLIAQLYYLSSPYVKADIIGNNKAEYQKYCEADKKSTTGQLAAFVKNIRALGLSGARDKYTKDMLAEEEVDKENHFNPEENEADWRKKNAALIYKHHMKLLLKPLKALGAGFASFVVYSYIISMSSLPIAIVLAAASAIYVGVFIDSFIEDMFLNLVFGRPSDFSYGLLSEVNEAFKTITVSGKEVKVLTKMYYAKLIAQKISNFTLMLVGLPIIFVIATIKLPIKFISNCFAAQNSQISKVQLASLLSFALATLFLVMTTSIPPLLAICMALYMNSVMSYGMMKLSGVFIVDDTTNKGAPMFNLFDTFGLNLGHILISDDSQMQRRYDFNKWTKGNCNPRYIEKHLQDSAEGRIPPADSYLQRIINFKGG